MSYGRSFAQVYAVNDGFHGRLTSKCISPAYASIKASYSGNFCRWVGQLYGYLPSLRLY